MFAFVNTWFQLQMNCLKQSLRKKYIPLIISHWLLIEAELCPNKITLCTFGDNCRDPQQSAGDGAWRDLVLV